MKRIIIRAMIAEKLPPPPCRGKFAFSTELAARMAAQGAINRPNTRARRRATMLYVYRCPECDRWHMTSCARRPGQPNGNPVTATSLGMEGSTQ